ncbi:MAG: flagellin [Vannielia sp.]|uniref:flagellin n=1 Tax=Rhodobacterales TaxID=204455 RepID=UPI00273A723F|nr:flagellin [Oceanicola sp. 502str15]MCO6383716.1 flagellin [Oceanicola sp. 502str15]
MSSILTNTSSMVALQTLRGINSSLEQTQAEISTGKSVGSARDNSAIWAISKVMESDVRGFKAISESLSLGDSTVAVARNGSETVTDLLVQMKEKIVGAQEENVDQEKLQADIAALTDQISSVVGAAQFNGLNLLSGTEDVNVLSSLDRSSTGDVAASDITVARQDLTFDDGVMGTGASLVGGAAITAGDAAVTGGNVTVQAGAGQNFDASSTRDFSNAANGMAVTIGGTVAADDVFNLQVAGQTVSFTATTTVTDDVAAGLTAALNAAGIEDVTAEVAGSVITINSTSAFEDIEVNGSTTGSGTFSADFEGVTVPAAPASSFTGAVIEDRSSEVVFSATSGVSEGDGYRVSVGGTNYDYIAGKGETFEDVARGLKIAIDGAGLSDISTNVYQDEATGAWTLQVDNDGAALALAVDGLADGEATGGLAGLDDIDVTTAEGVEAALANIETYIDTAIGAAAAFGSVEGRIETQSEFISNLTDSLTTGIGSLVDADMEAASARLQALQVQQQLGIQSLSIANQAPQSILSLFG